MALPIQLTGDLLSVTPAEYDGIRPYIVEEGHLAFLKPKVVTTAIGDDYAEQIDLASLLQDTPEAKARLRDLAIRISERGVCFFDNQSINFEEQKELVVRMTHATGSPESSGTHIHPVSTSDGGKKFQVSNKVIEEHGKDIFPNLFANNYWHVDGTFEHIGPAYSCLKLLQSPNGGGDTLFCSLFDAVDKLSPSLISYLETLNAEHDASWYKNFGKDVKIATNRGSPENSDTSLTSVHPVIATHPITGWKRLNVNRAYTKQILGVTKQESDYLLEYLYKIISDNHDIQARYRWDNNSVALWDNRSVAHCVTNDYQGKLRYGERAICVGERSVVDKSSLTKAQALKQIEEQNKTQTNAINGGHAANNSMNPSR